MRLLDAFTDAFTYISLLLRDPSTVAEAEKETVRADLDKLLEQAAHTAANIDRESFDSARFAVCAWIDEQLLASSWEGKQAWLAEPLQKSLYGTVRAGEEFYARLDCLLGPEPDQTGSSPDASSREQVSQHGLEVPEADRGQVIEVYAACLALGFTGSYFHDRDRDALREFKESCLRVVSGSEGSGAGDRLFPRAYPGHSGSRRKWYRAAGPGLAAAFLLPVVVLVSLYLIYNSMLSDMLHTLLSAY